MLDYVRYVVSSIECIKIFIGIVLIILSLKKGRKNELYLQYKSEFKE